MKDKQIIGISLPIFAVLSLIIIGSTYVGLQNTGIVGCMAYMIVLGTILSSVGDHIPIVKDYLGGGSVVCIFGTAALVTFGIIPAPFVKSMKVFFAGSSDFINFALCALICGSIMGMERDMLKKAAVRYLPVLITAQVCGAVAVAVVGTLVGYGMREAILFIGIPVMGGGLGAGAIPLSQMFEAATGVPAATILSRMTPAVSLGNAIAIVLAGLLGDFANHHPALTGQGKLMPAGQDALMGQERPKSSLDYGAVGRGLLVAVCYYVVAGAVHLAVPRFHRYAYMVVLLIITKVAGLIPEQCAQDCFYFYNCTIKNTAKLLLVGIGVALIDLKAVVAAITPLYILLTGVVVVASLCGAMFAGKLVGFYPVASGISAGLCAVNMGGSGDIATLGAANRMELLPFAQISSRIGGSIILIEAGILVQLLR